MTQNTILQSYTWSVGIACIVLVAIYSLIPTFSPPPNSENQIEEVRVFDAGPHAQVRRPSVNDPIVHLNDQFKHYQDKVRQFSYVFNLEDINANLAIFAPTLGGPANLSINGAPFTRSQSQELTAYGFGQEYIYTDIETRYLHPGLNRIDIILPEDVKGVGLRRLHVDDAPNIEALQKSYLNWLKILRVSGLMIGLVGGMCSFMGLLLGGHRTTMFGGMILSALVMIHSLEYLHIPTFDSALTSPTLIFLATFLMLIGMLGRNSLLTITVSGLILAALAVAALGLYTLSPFGYTALPIKTSSFTVLALYPALLFGLPLTLSSDVINFRQQAKTARKEADIKDEIITQHEAALRHEIEQKAIMQERQRFTRDMHDGIGGQLLSLLVRVRSGRVGLDGVETEIQSGLNDLRLVVDSLDHAGDDLLAALTTFQSRAQAQLVSQNINLIWIQNEFANPGRFQTRRILHLYRFLQEAVTNIIRHSKATSVRIEISSLDQINELHFVIEDNGKGMLNPDQKRMGKGLKNMNTRAEKLGGTLTFGIPLTEQGTRIELAIPLNHEL